MDPEITQNTQPAPIALETNQVQPENIPVQPIPPSTKSKLPLILGIIILLGIVGSLGVLGGKYFSGSKSPVTIKPEISPVPTQIPTPTSDQIINWKTYSATGIYEIRYPENLYSVKSGETSLKAEWPGIITIYPNDSFNSKSPLAVTYKVSIAISENSANLSLNQPTKLFGSGLLIQYSLSSEEINRIKDTTLGGLKAYRLDNLPVGLAGITADLITIKDSKIYEILVEPVQISGDPEVNKQIFEQIISTFSFLSKSSNQLTTTPTLSNPEGKFCGGFAGVACPAGYKCQLDGNYPDAGGKCVKN